MVTSHSEHAPNVNEVRYKSRRWAMMSLLRCSLPLSVACLVPLQVRIGHKNLICFSVLLFSPCKVETARVVLADFTVYWIYKTLYLTLGHHTTIAEDSSHRMPIILNTSLYQEKQDLGVHHLPSILLHFGNAKHVPGSFSSKKKKKLQTCLKRLTCKQIMTEWFPYSPVYKQILWR